MKKKNVIWIPGMLGIVTYKDKTVEELDAEKYKHFLVQNPTIYSKEHNYTKAARRYDELAECGILNEDSIVIPHSLGTISFPKWLATRGMKIDTLMTLSGFMGNDLRPHWQFGGEVFNLFGYRLNEKQLNRVPSLVKHRHAIYSDNDRYIPEESLEHYAEVSEAKKHRLAGWGHFCENRKGIKHIPLLTQIVKEVGE